MNLENVVAIGKMMLVVVIGLPWIMGVVLFSTSWFGDGLSSGNQSKLLRKQQELIEECESNLPRNQHCVLVAQVIETE